MTNSYEFLEKQYNKMKSKRIEISGLMLRNEGDYVIVEVEINGKWHQVIKEFSGKIESAFSNIIEPDGIRNAIERGYPYP